MSQEQLNEYLAKEAGEYLEQLSRMLATPAPPEPQALFKLARGVRGSAQMAGATAIAAVAQRLEQEARAVAEGSRGWTPEARERCNAAVAELERLLYPDKPQVVPISALFYDDAGPHVVYDPPADGSGEPVPIESLLYQGEAALERALELKPAVAALVRAGDQEGSAALIEEIFDLIRLAKPADA